MTQATTGLGKRRVLLVDDSLTVLMRLQQIIGNTPGFEVVGTACDGAAGVQQYVALSPDVVVMDIVMPVLDGVEAARVILARDPNARIVMLTSLADSPDAVVQALRCGAVTVLRKPPSPEELMRAVSSESVAVERG